MIYKDFKGKKLSALGMGAMRLPICDGDFTKIDEAATADMIALAIERGVNYFDTAWGYHEGNSELVMGKLLQKYPRESFYLATKFPGYDTSNMAKVEKIFEKQLEKCRVDYFDFYMFHNVCELNIDGYLDEKYGILKYLKAQKAAGRIRHLGFSAHGSYENMKRFLDAYGADMEFCQIQLNYIDWTLQGAKQKVELLREYNIPVWVMEPLRGGKLATLDEKQTAMLKAARPDESTPAWAFRFIQGLPEVVMTLSGMSNLEQMRENIDTFETDVPLSQTELDTLFSVADDMLKKVVVPCTDCKYCTSHCPQELNIPYLLELYNESSFTGGGFLSQMALSALPADKQPSSCIGCRSCEAVCPQQIKISEVLEDFVQKLK